MKAIQQLVKPAIGCLITGLLLSSSVTLASTITDSFAVSAMVNSSCSTVTANDMAFGNFDPLSGAPKDDSSTVTVTCTNGTPFNVLMNGGSNGTVAQRKMTDGASGNLNYNIYRDASHSTVWGDTIGTDTEAGIGTGNAEDFMAYGRISSGLPNTNAPQGQYADTILVTVDY